MSLISIFCVPPSCYFGLFYLTTTGMRNVISRSKYHTAVLLFISFPIFLNQFADNNMVDLQDDQQNGKVEDGFEAVLNNENVDKRATQFITPDTKVDISLTPIACKILTTT